MTDSTYTMEGLCNVTNIHIIYKDNESMEISKEAGK